MRENIPIRKIRNSARGRWISRCIHAEQVFKRAREGRSLPIGAGDRRGAEDRVTAYIDACVASPRLEPGPGCPIVPPASTVQPSELFIEYYVDVSWTVVEYPGPVLAVIDSALHGDSLLLTFREEGAMEGVAHSDGYIDVLTTDAFDYGATVEFSFHCPIRIAELQLQIDADGDFSIVPSEREEALQTLTARYASWHGCTSF
ncbi:hypothetical protein AB0A73_06730 [Glycomyces sp. NPDC047369]